MFDRKKNYYVRKIAEETGRKYKKVLADIQLDCAKFGITFREYYIGEIHKVSPHKKKKAILSIVRNKTKNKERIRSIKSSTGMDAKTILRNINELRKKEILNVTLAQYEKYAMFDKSDSQNLELMENLKYRSSLVKELRAKLPMLDSGELSYDEFEHELSRVYELTKKVLEDDYKQKIKQRIKDVVPQNMMTEDIMDEIVEDMEVTRLVLKFGYTEYIMFDFFGKSLREKRTFLSSGERREVLNKLNGSRISTMLNNKFLCYEQMKPYYGREAVLINDVKAFKTFEQFMTKYREAVVKPTELSFGQGIVKIESSPHGDLRKRFDELLKSYGEFIIEELIIQHQATGALNPYSVNTVRISVYCNEEKTIIQRPFMKIGRKGSFVDNGGSGGMLVAVDFETGKLYGSAIDETGARYDKHPESGILFDGYQLPNWDEAKKLAGEISNKIKENAYIGWDFACTSEGKWIVVEGNAMTQFIGQQAPQTKGMREEFLKEVVQ